MGRFVTAKSRIEQVDEPGYWRTLDNDGSLYLTPRYMWSDGYTFPGLIMAMLGDKHFYDVRPAHGHDLFCRFHESVKINLSLATLKMKGYLRLHNDKVVLAGSDQSTSEITVPFATNSSNATLTSSGKVSISF